MSKQGNELSFTGERFIPTEEGSIAYEHLHRYAFACDYVSGKTVLDVACGEGYGSSLLAKRAEKVIGVDLSEDTILHAREKYGNQPKIEFFCGSAADIPCKTGYFDVVVSFETIEHLAEHDRMFDEIMNSLVVFGVVLAICVIFFLSKILYHKIQIFPPKIRKS